MWFFFALLVMIAWGSADLFYKKGADESDRYSHLKTTMMVGIVMGIHAFVMLIVTDMNYDPINLLIYLPVSLCYIISMAVGYFGLRYLELSISSPIQNSSGAVVCIMCLVFLGQRMDVISSTAVILICIGVFMLGVFEKERQKEYETQFLKKYKIGFAAFLMPVIYCIIDSLGTFLDAYYLDDIETTPLRNVTESTFENVANTSYELTFFIAAVIILIYMIFVKKEKISLPEQKDRALAAVFETAGQFAYVYAMSGNAVVAAPMVASYSIVSIVLSRIFIKEKLNVKQYAVIVIVMLGIAMLGIAEGLSE